SFAPARYQIEGDEPGGWRVTRDGVEALTLGPGYRALRTRACGVCSTDLARHFLPFPLPQVIGHEVVAVDPDGRRYVVEINASHAARGVAADCPFCAAGLPTHCPSRMTLGIDTLPGGFGPWILAPVAACVEVPAEIPDDDAVLVEPLAAAMHAVATVAPRADDRVAVLGPRRLGMLVVAALHAARTGCAVEAVVRDAGLSDLARSLGAGAVHVLEGERDAELQAAFDVVIDTTGSPSGLERALRLARREVHLKSTHGQRAGGVAHLTEFVVDELALSGMPRDPEGRRVAWLAAQPPSGAFAAAAELAHGAPRAELMHGAPDELARRYDAAGGVPHADAVVVDSVATFERAVRPIPGVERPLARPRGDIWLHPDAAVEGSTLLQAVRDRGVRVSSSRCGDFRAALAALATPSLRGLGRRFVTHRFDASELPRAFDVARTRACIKAVVEHGGAAAR
ncbi:MAG: alcohol dehydrogenase catalytic domain-containing protein, partial [Planctomycetota bacterium]|nr:alcohol dehydrogenase catalytic domain-containing protein [Planctomycetota bacterium]